MDDVLLPNQAAAQVLENNLRALLDQINTGARLAAGALSIMEPPVAARLAQSLSLYDREKMKADDEYES